MSHKDGLGLVKIIKRGVIFLFCLIPFLVLYYSTRTDDVISPTMSMLSSTSEYTMYDQYGVDLLGSGTLGKFYACLINYRGIAGRRKKGYGSQAFTLRFQNGVSLEISASYSETFQFNSVIDVNGNRKLSKSYAINCKLSLLDTSSEN